MSRPRSRFQMIRSTAWFVAAGFLAFLAASAGAVAQDASAIDPDEVRELIGSRGFHDHNHEHDHDDGDRRLPAELPESVDVGAIQGQLEDISSAAHTLYHRLRAQDAAVPGLRRHTGDLLRLQVRVDELAGQITSRAELQAHLEELQKVDSQWRQLSYNLGMISELGEQSRELISRIDHARAEISEHLEMGASVDYRNLVGRTNALAAALDRLVEDLDYLHGRTGQARELIAQARSIEQQAIHLADGVFQRFEHEHLASDFQVFRESWREFLGELRRLDEALLDKDVQNINAIKREVASLLWVEHTLDRTQLVYLAEKLTRDVDRFFNSAPLKMIMYLPESEIALSTADAFYGNFQNFVDVVKRGEGREDLQYAFRFIDDAWHNFARVFRPLQSTEAQKALSTIERDLEVLRDALLIQSSFDRGKAAELASKVATLAMYIERDTNDWLRKEPQRNSAEIRREVTEYRRHADQLYEAINRGAPVEQIRKLCEATFDDWRTVYEHIINCYTSERASLASSSSETTPALVELRSVFGG